MTTDQPVPVLDDSARMQSIDRRNMLRLLNELPEQYETALGIGRSFVIEPLSVQPNVVFITGTGDSATAADMAAAVIGEDAVVPIISDHGGRLPAYVGEQSLVFIVDYAGKSPSALRNYREAKLRGVEPICVTSGGKLHETASKEGGRIVRIQPGQPARTALGYLFVPLVTIVEKCGLIEGSTERLSYAIRLMKNIRESFRFDTPTPRNIAKQIAGTIFGNAPIIYGVTGYRATVARRWKSQITVNAKLPACAEVLPDAADAEVSAWEPADRELPKAAFVFLEDAVDRTTEIRDLADAVKRVMDNYETVAVEMKGSTLVEKLLYGIYLGDYVSYYLALLNEVDPMIAENIAYVAAALAGQPLGQ